MTEYAPGRIVALLGSVEREVVGGGAGRVLLFVLLLVLLEEDGVLGDRLMGLVLGFVTYGILGSTMVVEPTELVEEALPSDPKVERGGGAGI